MIVEAPLFNHYSVIYADPAWTFKTYSNKGKGRSAEAHYDCMSLEDIKALPVSDWAAKDCVLLMWITDPMLEKGFEVIKSWGFIFKTVGFYWVKTSKDGIKYPINCGYYSRGNPEQCLLATRGKPKRLNADVRKLIISPRREHSRKPDEIYDRIERLFDGPKLEMFARQSYPGWDAWGLQAEEGITRRKWKSNEYPKEK